MCSNAAPSCSLKLRQRPHDPCMGRSQCCTLLLTCSTVHHVAVALQYKGDKSSKVAAVEQQGNQKARARRMTVRSVWCIWNAYMLMIEVRGACKARTRRMTVRSLLVWCTSLRYTHQRAGSTSSW